MKVNKKTLSIIIVIILMLLYFFVFQHKKYELPWELWRAIQKEAQAQPDHLLQQAKQLRQEGTPEAIFQFVRDRIIGLPVQKRNSKTYWNRWGVEGVLRSGFGTPYEKVRLLQDLLEYRGYQSNIEWIKVKSNFELEAYHPYLLSSMEAFDESQIKHWENQITGKVNWKNFAQLNTREDSIVGQASNVASLSKMVNQRTKNWNAHRISLPLLQLTIDSQQVYLNPHNRQLKFGEKGFDENLKTVNYKRVGPVPRLGIRVLASYNDNQYTPFPILEGHWQVHELLGKDIHFDFNIIGPPYIILQSKINDFESFVPSLHVEGMPADSTRFHLSGDVITTSGKVIKKDEAKKLLDKDLNLATGDASQLGSMKLKMPKFSNYPTVEVEAEVTDKNGNPLMGLESEDFTFTVNGESVRHRAVINQKLPPRIMIAYDQSGSVPLEYRKKTKLIKLFQAIIEKAQSVNPDTEFKMAGVGSSESLLDRPSGWLSMISELSHYIYAFGSKESNNWSALAGGVSEHADFLILLTDADGTQDENIFHDLRIAEGIPALIIAIEGNFTLKEQFAQMAEATDGKYFEVQKIGEFEKLLDEVAHRIGTTKEHRYLFELEMENPDIPIMDIGIGNGAGDLFDIMEELKVPIAAIKNKPVGHQAITGLYLQFEFDNKTITHRLAGLPWKAKRKYHTLTPEMVEECERALWGNYTIHLEGAPPTSSLLIDELCHHFLQLENLNQLLEEPDPERFFEQLPIVQWHPDFHAKWSLLRAYNPTKPILQEGLLTWIHSVQPNSEGSYTERISTLDLGATIPLGVTDDALQAELEYRQLIEKNYPSKDANIWGNPINVSYPSHIDEHYFEPDKRMIDNPLCWPKVMQMKMDTWSDLEANKLSYAQVGTVAIKNLGNQIPPDELMELCKAQIQSYIRTELKKNKTYFSAENYDATFVKLYNSIVNNLANISFNQNQDDENL